MNATQLTKKLKNRTISLFMAIIIVITGMEMVMLPNSEVASAATSKTKQVVILESSKKHVVKVGQYIVKHDQDKVNIVKGKNTIFSKKIASAVVVGDNLYWGKPCYPEEDSRVYCYDIVKNENTVFVDMNQKVKNGYRDACARKVKYGNDTYFNNLYEYATISRFFAYHNDWLFYELGGAGYYILHRANVKTGEVQLLGNYSSEMDTSPRFHMVKDGYAYIYYTFVGDTNNKDQFDNKPYTRIDMNKNSGKEEVVIENCSISGQTDVLCLYKNKLYYVEHVIRKGKKIKYDNKQTTYLKCCNLDGSKKKTLYTWNSQATVMKQFGEGKIYLENCLKNIYYQYDIKTKKLVTIKELPEEY